MCASTMISKEHHQFLQQDYAAIFCRHIWDPGWCPVTLSICSLFTMPPHTVSLDLKACIPILRYSAGYSVKEICGILGIRKSLAYQTLQYYALHGVCYNLNSHKCGGHRKLTSTDINFIKSLVSQHHSIYLDKIQEQLFWWWGAQISIFTLTCTLCCLHLMNKDVLGHALEWNIEQWAIFMNQIADLVGDLNMLMFGD
jgi:hypothetical protein